MLTHSRIRKAAKLMQQVGELRPGFLKEEASAIEGPFAQPGAVSPPNRRSGVATRRKGRRLRVRLVFREDTETGEVQIIKH